MSPTITRRESPDSKRQKRKDISVKAAIESSFLDANNYQRKIAFHDLEELSSKLQVDEYWNIIHKDQSLLISHISISPPKMMLSVLVNDDKSVHAYIEDMPVKKLHDYVIPSHVQDTDTLAVILSELRKSDKQSKSAMNPVAVIQLVLTFLTVIKEQSFKYLKTLKFITPVVVRKCHQKHM